MKHLTFDIDWAPRWCVEETLDLLAQHNVKATYFITHDCPSVERIREEGHTLGLHPNLLPGSSHGKTPTDAIEYLLHIAPEAEVIRTHALVQSSPILYEIFQSFPQLKYDLSMLMYGFEHIGKFPWKYDGVEFERINYNWEDDCAFFEHGFSLEGDRLHHQYNDLRLPPYSRRPEFLQFKAVSRTQDRAE